MGMTMSEDGTVLLTMAEVAQLLHCSKAHVCNLAGGRVRGCAALPAIHMGRRMLVRRESLLRWLTENESGSIRHRQHGAIRNAS
jgi:excisionase family DNA binding protein